VLFLVLVLFQYLQ